MEYKNIILDSETQLISTYLFDSMVSVFPNFNIFRAKLFHPFDSQEMGFVDP